MWVKCQCRNVKRHTSLHYCLLSHVPSRRATLGHQRLETTVALQEQTTEIFR